MISPTKNEDKPEIYIGVAGPVGVDLEAITSSVERELLAVGYNSVVIRLTELMTPLIAHKEESADNSFDVIVNKKMDQANSICESYKDSGAMARVAMHGIFKKRQEITGSYQKPAFGTAFIIRQLKRPDEVRLLRNVYGRQFILISAYGSEDDRKRYVVDKIKRSASTFEKNPDLMMRAMHLLERDADEQNPYGQHLRDTFHLADLFVDGMNKSHMETMIRRFVDALFGRTDISPSKTEYGMYAAKSASLRSADLSRQVGAAIFSDDGELITQGCNEVPKAFGGTYWDLEAPDFRDVKIGRDPNEVIKRELIRDLVERLQKEGFLSDKCVSIGSAPDIVEALIKKDKNDETGEIIKGALADAAIMDLTEYGRVVHAEMCAICDAARLGRSVKGSTLFCTTFPCHNCTKHILASGIKKVIYIEPYPKSRARELHGNEIEIESEASKKVSFVPFIGISPFRYRDIFQKGRRKNGDGAARTWINNQPQLMVDTSIGSTSYLEPEAAAIALLFGTIGNELETN